MKKRVLLNLLLIILLINQIFFVYAQEIKDSDNILNAKSNIEFSKSSDTQITTTNSQENLSSKDENKLNQLTGRVDQFFKGESSFIVPENLKIPARFIFGIQGDISLQVLIILIAIWIILLILINEIMSFMPILNNGIQKIIVSFIITCLIALSGGIRSGAVLFLNMGNLFGFLESKYTAVGFIAAIIIVVMFGYGFKILLKILKNKMDLEGANQTGNEIGFLAKIAKISYRETTKKD